MDYSPPIITSKKPNIGKAFVEKTVLNPPSNPLTHEIHLNQQQSSSWVHLVKSHKVAILTVILVIITCYFGPKIYSKYVSHKYVCTTSTAWACLNVVATLGPILKSHPS